MVQNFFDLILGRAGCYDLVFGIRNSGLNSTFYLIVNFIFNFRWVTISIFVQYSIVKPLAH
jgi:hypothetical protein